MNIRDLIAFKVVAEEGSISRAAERLNFVQSNVTNKIKQLENHFECPLFYRHRHGVSLTPTGKTLLRYTEQILQLFDEAEKSIKQAEVPSGVLAIGSMETTAAVRLPELLATYSNAYPQVELLLKTGPTAELIEKVLNYQLEGAFVAGPVHHPQLVQEIAFEEELVLVSKHAFDPLTLEKQTILVFKSGCSYRHLLEEWLKSQGVQPTRIMEFGSLEAILGCVRAGMGISLLPTSVVERSGLGRQLQYYSIPAAYSRVTTVFIRRKNTVLTKALQMFLKQITNNPECPGSPPGENRH